VLLHSDTRIEVLCISKEELERLNVETQAQELFSR
jgi:hypothetical protein